MSETSETDMEILWSTSGPATWWRGVVVNGEVRVEVSGDGVAWHTASGDTKQLGKALGDALLRRGESRPATVPEIDKVLRRHRVGSTALEAAYCVGWRDAEAYHAIGTAPAAHEGEQTTDGMECPGCGELIEIPYAAPAPDAAREYPGLQPTTPWPDPPAPDAAREGISETDEFGPREGEPVDRLLSDLAAEIEGKEDDEPAPLLMVCDLRRLLLLAARPAPQAKGSEPSNG